MLKRVAKRFSLWLLICGISAAPSFVLGAMDRANTLGMASGVLLFVGLYTLITCTARFQALYQKPHIRPTLYFGYGARLFVSSLGILTAIDPSAAGMLVLPDLLCGILSVQIGSALLDTAQGDGYRAFHVALLITCIQGALLNVFVFILMLIFYLIRRKLAGSPLERRGFEVLPAASLAEPLSTDFPRSESSPAPHRSRPAPPA
jgi:hypothetical protein